MKSYSQNHLLEFDELLCFDDILLLPKYSTLASRTDPDISVKLGHLDLKTPILSAPMDSITKSEMLVAMSNAGGLGILTRFINTPNETSLQCSEISRAKENGAKHIGCAIGIKNGVSESANALLDVGCDVICLDVAHGDHTKMYDAINQLQKLKNKHTFSIMSGNICTPEAAKRFYNSGVDICKVGIGPGAVCTTRRITGCGCPQLAAILSCQSVISQKMSIVADGGLRTSGDMVKALWAGANACMVGYMLAGTSATPDIHGEKMYRGMSSRTVHQRSDVAAEGVEIKMAYGGKTDEKLVEFIQGIRSGLAMTGAKNIDSLRDAKAVRVTSQTKRESDPIHG